MLAGAAGRQTVPAVAVKAKLSELLPHRSGAVMSPVSRGPVPDATSGLQRISLNPAHFRSGRWLLLAEGLLVGALGSAGLVSAGLHSGPGPAGAPVPGLTLTPEQSGLLLGFALLAVLAAGYRRAAVIITGVGAAAFLLLLVIGGVAAAYDRPGPFGFTLHGIFLHGVLAVVNLALLMWLIPDSLEGPEWVKRRGPQDRAPDRPQGEAPQ